MAFIEEIVPKEDWEKYNSFELKYDGQDCIVNEKIGRYLSWHVDRERDIYLIFLGGCANERPLTYALIWRKQKIIIDAEVRATIEYLGAESESHWYIKRIKATQEMSSYKNELIEIILEAVRATGNFRRVVIKEIPDITYISEDGIKK